MNKEQIIYTEGKPHIECDVVILFSPKGGNIFNTDESELFRYSGKILYENILHQIHPFNLYITSNEEIKEGDWIIWNNKVVKAINTVYSKDTKKIIATTNTSLTIKGEQEGENTWYNPLPQLSQQFIEKYIEEYNKANQINTVLVEVEDNLPGHVDNRDGKFKTFGDLRAFYMILKINPQNQITIRKQKDSWSREEVIDLSRSAYLYGEQGALKLHNGVFKEWLKENL